MDQTILLRGFGEVSKSWEDNEILGLQRGWGLPSFTVAESPWLFLSFLADQGRIYMD